MFSFQHQLFCFPSRAFALLMMADKHLFPPSVLESSLCQLRDNNLVMRPLSEDDFDHGYMQLLQQLTDTGKVTKENFEGWYQVMIPC